MEKLELHLDSKKAVKAANEFRTAVLRAAEAADKLGGSIDRLDQAMNRIGTRATSAAAPLTKVGSAAQRSGESMRRGASGAREYDDRLGRLDRTAARTGLSMGRLLGILGGVAAIRGGIRAFASYEDQLAVLGTIANEAGGGLDNLERSAREVSRATKLFRTSDAISGLTELARAGQTSGQAIASLKPTADLATVGLLSLDKSAAIVTKTLAQYNLRAEESGRIADVLAKGANSTNTDVAGLAFSLSKAGVSANQFGVDLETTVAALGELANKGVQADRAGTGLARIMIRLANPTERARDALRELGLSAADVNPKANGLIGVLRNLNDANLTLTQSGKLVDAEFQDLLQALTNSVPKIQSLEGALNAAGGTAAQQAAARFDTLGGAFANLGGATEELVVSLGESGLAEGLKDTANFAADVLRVLSGDAQAFLDASDGAKAAAAGVKGLTAAITGLAIGKVVKGLYDASKAMLAFNAAAAANPLGLIVTAVSGVATAYYLFSDSLDEASANLQFQRDEAQRSKEKYEDLERAIRRVYELERRSLPVGRSDLQAVNKQLEELRIQFENVREASNDLFTARGGTTGDFLADMVQQVEAGKNAAKAFEQSLVDLASIERLGSIAPEGSDLKRVADLSAQYRGAQREVEELSAKVGDLKRASDAALAEQQKFADRGFLGAQEFVARQEDVRRLEQVRERAAQAAAALREFGVETRGSGQVLIVVDDALKLVGDGLTRVQDIASKAGVALQSLFGQGSTGIRSTVSVLVEEEEKRLDILQLQGAEREKAQILAQLEKKGITELNESERASINALVEKIVKANELIEARRKERREIEKTAEQQRKLPGTLDEIESRLRAQLAIAQSEGELRTRLIAEQKAAAALPPITLIDEKDPERAAKLREQYEAIRDLFVQIERANAERKKTDEPKNDNSAELFRRLAQEEALVRALGDEKQRLAIIQAAENEAVAAGIERGSLLAKQYEERVLAVERLARTQEEFGRTFGQAGQIIGDGLFDAIRQAESLDDALRNVIERLGQLAFQKAVTDNLSKLLTVGGQAVANSLFGGSQNPNARFDGPSRFDGEFAPRLSGGLIPAMAGQLVASPTVLTRGGRNYSVAEGGGVTPEAIFPLQRDSQGRLGVVAAGGGGGGETIIMNFPSVRNAQDARAVRATRGQIARRVSDADKRGRRGLRPSGV